MTGLSLQRCDRLEVLDNAARRRLRVVRRDDEEAVDADLVSLLREVHRLGGRVRTGAGDHGRPFSDGADGDAEELEPLVLRERRRLARRARDDETIRAVVDEMVRKRCKAVEVHRAVLAERRDDGGQDLAEHEVIVAAL